MVEKRQINAAERKVLMAEIERREKDLNTRLNWKAIIILTVITFLSAIHIYYYDDSNWSLISKFLVSTCPIVIWVVFEIRYKGKKKEKNILNELKKINKENSIDTIKVTTDRVIQFEQQDDEGVLFLIETKKERIYLDDEQWLIPYPRKFPCKEFDIYLDKNFSYALGRKVYCSGKKIDPIKIPAKIKWKLFEDGWPLDISKEPRTIEEILSEIKSIELSNLI